MRIVMVAALMAAGCGPSVDNTDKSPGANPAVGSFGVTMSDERPETGGYPVEGISCKNNLWDPEPTNESAKSVMRREAAKFGYKSAHLLIVEPVKSAYGLNCWAAISAKGIAFNPG